MAAVIWCPWSGSHQRMTINRWNSSYAELRVEQASKMNKRGLRRT